jgi:hypothetical protein
MFSNALFSATPVIQPRSMPSKHKEVMALAVDVILTKENEVFLLQATEGLSTTCYNDIDKAWSINIYDIYINKLLQTYDSLHFFVPELNSAYGILAKEIIERHASKINFYYDLSEMICKLAERNSANDLIIVDNHRSIGFTPATLAIVLQKAGINTPVHASSSLFTLMLLNRWMFHRLLADSNNLPPTIDIVFDKENTFAMHMQRIPDTWAFPCILKANGGANNEVVITDLESLKEVIKALTYNDKQSINSINIDADSKKALIEIAESIAEKFTNCILLQQWIRPIIKKHRTKEHFAVMRMTVLLTKSPEKNTIEVEPVHAYWRLTDEEVGAKQKNAYVVNRNELMELIWHVRQKEIDNMYFQHKKDGNISQSDKNLHQLISQTIGAAQSSTGHIQKTSEEEEKVVLNCLQQTFHNKPWLFSTNFSQWVAKETISNYEKKYFQSVIPPYMLLGLFNIDCLAIANKNQTVINRYHALLHAITYNLQFDYPLWKSRSTILFAAIRAFVALKIDYQKIPLLQEQQEEEFKEEQKEIKELLFILADPIIEIHLGEDYDIFRDFLLNLMNPGKETFCAAIAEKMQGKTVAALAQKALKEYKDALTSENVEHKRMSLRRAYSCYTILYRNERSRILFVASHANASSTCNVKCRYQ